LYLTFGSLLISVVSLTCTFLSWSVNKSSRIFIHHWPLTIHQHKSATQQKLNIYPKAGYIKILPSRWNFHRH